MKRVFRSAAIGLVSAVSMLWLDTAPTSAASPAGTKITASTGLFPAFDRNVTDYVTRCVDGSPLQLDVEAPNTSSVAIAGNSLRTGTFSQSLTLGSNQSLTILLNTAGSLSTHYVRCLPSDFPQTTVEKNGAPQSAGYLGVIVPTAVPTATRYNAYFDNNGVPIWWSKISEPGLIFGTLLPNNNIGIATMGVVPPSDTRGIAVNGIAREETLEGTKVSDIKVASGELDQHEILRLPNGNYMIIANVERPNVDLTSIGGPANTSLLDQEIQEVTPAGALVSTWTTGDHVGINEVVQEWWAPILDDAPYDVFHANSIEIDGDDMIVSYRHLNAIYRINRITGAIEWKLGGVTTPDSLTSVNDPIASLGGQHDARVLPDGTVTIHDNLTGRGIPPRALRYSIDATTKTATLLESVGDPEALGSGCCGSARRLPGGNWVTSWGFNPFITELSPAGQPVLRIRVTGGFLYRVEPIMPGRIDIAAFRSAMNTKVAPYTSSETQHDGYRLVAGNGSVSRFGASGASSSPSVNSSAPIVGAAATPSGTGLWIVAADGGVFNDGDAGFFGSMSGKPLNAPITGIAPTSTGRGYWLVAADGGIFAFGDAQFLGSTGGMQLNAPITGIDASPSGDGYLLVARDGGVFAFGDAQFHGSQGGKPLNKPVVGITVNADGSGYWLVAADGGVFSYGQARFAGSTGSMSLNAPIVGIRATTSGQGYWLAGNDGGVFAFGDAPFQGSAVGSSKNIVAFAS